MYRNWAQELSFDLDNEMRRMMHEMADPDLQLTSPPWPNSWNFGLSACWLQICEVLRARAELFIMRNRMQLRTRRELHISWN